MCPGTLTRRAQDQPDSTNGKPPAPFEEILEVLKPLHRDKRILIIDDMEVTAFDVKTGLSPFFPESQGNLIEIESDPLAVAGRMQAAIEEGRPYDAIILDLRMPKKNGDELLRDLASEGLLCPVVIHSASHAKGIQCQLLPQVDELRSEELRRRVKEIEGVDALLDDVKTPEELEGLRTTLSRKTDGVPSRFVLKYGRGYRPERLSRALEAVMLTGEETDMDSFQQAVSQFKPTLWDGGDHTEYVEELSEMAKYIDHHAHDLMKKIVSHAPEVVNDSDWTELMVYYFKNSGAERTRELIGSITTQNPEIDESAEWRNCLAQIKELEEKGEYNSGYLSVESLTEITPAGDDFIDYGASRRHNLPQGTVGFGYQMLCQVFHEAYKHRLDREEDIPTPKAAFKDNDALLAEVLAFDDKCRSIGPLMMMPRNLKEDAHTVELNKELKFIVRHMKCGTIIPEEKIHISSPGMLYDEVISQPIMNAAQIVKGVENGKVTASLDKTRVADLDEKSRTYFTEEQGLSIEDEVAHVVVHDNGPGIPPEDLDKIFDANYTTRKGGTGFGLHYLKRYIGKMDGTYHVESEPGNTNFHMYFKLAEPDET